MEAQLQANKLREALRKVGLALPARVPSLPIMTYARLVCTNMGAHLTATNLERAIEIDLPGFSADGFDVLFPCKTLRRFLGKSYDGQVTFKFFKASAHGALHVELGQLGVAEFGSIPVATEFPSVPEIAMPVEPILINRDGEEHAREPIELVVKGAWFARMALICAQHCTTDDTRPILTGVAFAREGCMVAADGIRLAVVEDESLKYEAAKDFIIPYLTMIAASKLFAKTPEVKIRLGDPCSVFEADGVKLTTQNIQGTFPQYRQLIPQAPEYKVSFSVPLMLERLGMLGTEVIREIVKFEFSGSVSSDGQPHEGLLSCGDADERFRVSVPVTSNGACKVALARHYVVTAIHPFAMVDLGISNPVSPIVIKGDIEGLTVVIMPMFVQW